MSAEATSILRDNDQDWIPTPLPGSDGVHLKVIRADPETGRVLARVRFAPDTRMPRHRHFCRAIAYTLSGAWEYDEGKFYEGDIAWEEPGAEHTPWSDEGAELALVFDCDREEFLENFMPDGSTVIFGMKLLKALEGISESDAAALEMASLVTVVPPVAADA